MSGHEMSAGGPSRAEPEVSPYLAGANWLLRLAHANGELSTPQLLALLNAEVEVIREYPSYFPDDARLVMSDAARGALIERVYTEHRMSKTKI